MSDERPVPTALLDKLVCDVDEIHRRVCDGALFRDLDLEPPLGEGRFWIIGLNALVADPRNDLRIDCRVLDANRLEMRFVYNGHGQSWPLIVQLLPS